MAPFETLALFDYSILASDIGFLQPGSKCVVNTINQYSYIMAEKDPVFKKALLGSDVLLPDGIGIVVAAKVMTNKKIKKIAGADLHLYLLQRLQATGGSCFYLGSSETTLSAIGQRLGREFPGVRAGFYSPPFKQVFDENDNRKMVEAVNTFRPDVLFIGMTAPKQEKWSADHRDQLQANVICSIGAVFDFYAGTISRPGNIWIKLGLEWFVRLVREPRRMSKRYLYYGFPFVLMIARQKIRNLFLRKAKTALG